MTMRILCLIAHLCSAIAIQSATVVISGDGNLVRKETLPSGARSFTDELALKMEHVKEASSLLQAESLDTSCELPSGGRWCTARSGGKSWQMAVYAGPDPVSNTICQTGFWEHGDPTNLGVPAGSNQLLDIGANVGWYTFMFAQNGYNVLAVEPMTANRALIKATMCQNPELASKITVVAAALTDKVDKPGQKCSIFSANINLGDGLVACGDQQIAELRNKEHNNAQIQHIEREQVPLTTLDEVLASSKLKNIDVMKMDVERYECHVLGGASTLFTRFHPKGLMIETRSSGKEEHLKSGMIGSTTDCTVKAVMKGGNYKIHEDNIAGKVVPEPTGAGVFNLYFSLNENAGASLLQGPEGDVAGEDGEAVESDEGTDSNLLQGDPAGEDGKPLKSSLLQGDPDQESDEDDDDQESDENPQAADDKEDRESDDDQESDDSQATEDKEDKDSDDEQESDDGSLLQGDPAGEDGKPMKSSLLQGDPDQASEEDDDDQESDENPQAADDDQESDDDQDSDDDQEDDDEKDSATEIEEAK